ERQQIPGGTHHEAIAEDQHPAEGQVNGVAGPKARRGHDKTNGADGKGGELRTMFDDSFARLIKHDVLSARQQRRKGRSKRSIPMFLLKLQKFQGISKVKIIQIEIAEESERDQK